MVISARDRAKARTRQLKEEKRKEKEKQREEAEELKKRAGKWIPCLWCLSTVRSPLTSYLFCLCCRGITDESRVPSPPAGQIQDVTDYTGRWRPASRQAWDNQTTRVK